MDDELNNQQVQPVVPVPQPQQENVFNSIRAHYKRYFIIGIILIALFCCAGLYLWYLNQKALLLKKTQETVLSQLLLIPFPFDPGVKVTRSQPQIVGDSVSYSISYQSAEPLVVDYHAFYNFFKAQKNWTIINATGELTQQATIVAKSTLGTEEIILNRVGNKTAVMINIHN